ncbi:MAG: alpha/beta hydrolase [Steroidobacteraceae bacterium]
MFTTAPAPGAARARPLVCLHPSPTSGEMFADLAAELAADRIVHRPDTPGFGASDAPSAKPTVADYGGALGDALADLGYGDERSPLGPVDLFGFHTGSLCAVELALQRPGMVRRLALAGVPHYESAQRERERASHVRPYPYFEERDYVGEMFRRLVLDARDSGEPEQRLRRFGDWLRAGRNGWWGPDAVFTYDSVTTLPRLALPTLFIAFNEEMTEPTRAASRLVAGARLVEMLDLPIFGFIVDPRRVAATLKSFFDAPQPQRTV